LKSDAISIGDRVTVYSTGVVRVANVDRLTNRPYSADKKSECVYCSSTRNRK